jgi:hypothetical protein
MLEIQTRENNRQEEISALEDHDHLVQVTLVVDAGLQDEHWLEDVEAKGGVWYACLQQSDDECP